MFLAVRVYDTATTVIAINDIRFTPRCERAKFVGVTSQVLTRRTLVVTPLSIVGDVVCALWAFVQQI